MVRIDFAELEPLTPVLQAGKDTNIYRKREIDLANNGNRYKYIGKGIQGGQRSRLKGNWYVRMHGEGLIGPVSYELDMGTCLVFQMEGRQQRVLNRRTEHSRWVGTE